MLEICTLTLCGEILMHLWINTTMKLRVVKFWQALTLGYLSDTWEKCDKIYRFKLKCNPGISRWKFYIIVSHSDHKKIVMLGSSRQSWTVSVWPWENSPGIFVAECLVINFNLPCVIFASLLVDMDVKIWMFLALHSEKTYFWFVENLHYYFLL